MSVKASKKLGFYAALAMLIGSVVGIGIFFKSHGILRTNDWNGIGTFLAWVIGGILSLAAAVSFSEIGNTKTKNVHGLPGWAETYGGKKFGYFTRFNYSFFYYGLLTAVLGVFGSEMIFMFITTFSNLTMIDFPVVTHVALGIGISALFLTLNIVSVKASGYIALASTILKWVPLVIVALAGIILATTNNATTQRVLPHLGQNAFTNGQSFKFTSMLAALPAVLFAFDAFIGVASLKNKMEKPEKLPTVVIVGMVSVLVLYLLIALSAILHGSGMVSGAPFGYKPAFGLGIFDQIFSASVAEAMGKFVVVFLVISTLGVINGVSAVAVSVHEQALKSNTIFGAKTLRNKMGELKTLIIYISSLTVFWTLVFGIPAIVLNSDSIIDGLSNFPTLFFFGIYGTVILLYTLKRKTVAIKKINNILFKTFAWIAIIGIGLVVGYQIIYGFFINVILHPDTSTHWGLFVGDTWPKNAKGVEIISSFPTKNSLSIGVAMTLAQASIVMFAMLTVFIGLPCLNRLLTKKFEKNEVIVDTQK